MICKRGNEIDTGIHKTNLGSQKKMIKKEVNFVFRQYALGTV